MHRFMVFGIAGRASVDRQAHARKYPRLPVAPAFCHNIIGVVSCIYPPTDSNKGVPQKQDFSDEGAPVGFRVECKTSLPAK